MRGRALCRVLGLLLSAHASPHTVQSSALSSLSGIGKITSVLSDMDGTLLGLDHKISKRNLQAIELLKLRGIPFFPATGRTRISMIETAGKDFLDLMGGDINKLSGVFSQGLVVAGRNGEIIHECFLSDDVIAVMEEYCENHDISVIAYAGDQILTTKQTFYTKLISEYKEPIPDLCSIPLHRMSAHGVTINKLILLADETELQHHRPTIAQRLNGLASLTKAVPRMLEVLPYGASKGEGVRILLSHYGLSPDECIAFGDGENDIEMFQLVKYGIAVANARPELMKHAHTMTLAHHADGVATIIEDIFRM
jgi:Cof subfamily protein (haloacid dehalogenase superfamily)